MKNMQSFREGTGRRASSESEVGERTEPQSFRLKQGTGQVHSAESCTQAIRHKALEPTETKSREHYRHHAVEWSYPVFLERLHISPNGSVSLRLPFHVS